MTLRRRLTLKIRRDEGKWRPIKFSPRKNRSRGRSAAANRRTKRPANLKDSSRGERSPGQTTSSRPTTRQPRGRIRPSDFGHSDCRRCANPRGDVRPAPKGRGTECTRKQVYTREEGAMLIIERDINEREHARFTYMKIIAKYTRVGLFSNHRPGAAFRFSVSFFLSFFF